MFEAEIFKRGCRSVFEAGAIMYKKGDRFWIELPGTDGSSLTIDHPMCNIVEPFLCWDWLIEKLLRTPSWKSLPTTIYDLN